MAIIDKNILAHPIQDAVNPDNTSAEDQWHAAWNGHTGLEVESFITENLMKQIKGMAYEGSTLKLVRENGEILETEVTVETPTPYYGIKLCGLDINGTKYLGNGTTITTQYTSSTVVKLGVILYAISLTTIRATDMIGPFDVKILYGQKSGTFKVSNVPIANWVKDQSGNYSDVKDESSILWVDITSLFTSSSNGASITATVVKDITAKSTLDLTIVNQKIELQYNNSIVVDDGKASFLVSGGTVGKYHLEGFNNGRPFSTSSSSLTYNELSSGLNQLVICAVHDDNASIKSEYISVDIINSIDVTETIAAINNVSSSIPNNGVATLYELTVYSPEKESIELVTYLEDVEPKGEGTTRVKREVISPSAYDKDLKYNTSYKKYIELVGGNSSRYLMIKIGGSYYRFYWAEPNPNGTTTAGDGIYRAMEIEAINTDLLPYQGQLPTYNFDQSTGSSNNIIVTADYAELGTPANVNPLLESSDGWYEEDGRTLFRLTAQETPLFTQPINLNLGNSFTIELGFKTYNISNADAPIMTLGNFQLRPTLFCWNTENTTLFKARNSQFLSNTETHLLITVEGGHKLTKQSLYYPNYLKDYQKSFDDSVGSLSYNLVRIFVNGVIDREIILTDDELTTLRKEVLQFNPKASDIDLYMLRIYNSNALPMDAVINNYTSFLKTKDEKILFIEDNDILNEDTGEISFDKCYGKYNTFVLVLPKGARFPNRAWGKEDGAAKKDFKDYPVTVLINYADPKKNKTNGGKFIDLQYLGQGSSAMRYLIWNTLVSANKFKDKQVDDEGNPVLDATGKLVELKRPSAFISYNDANFDADTNKFTADATTTWSGYYKMPTYTGQRNNDDSEVTKLVGKVNFASSMLSHKLGSVRLYDDGYKAAVGNLQSGGRKACNEEPFLYFYWESDLEASKSEKVTAAQNANVDFWKTRDPEKAIQQVNPVDLFNNPNVHFMGFHTWGSAKCDDATYGYNKNTTPGYILIEGGENTEPACNFKTPWMALQRAEGSGSTKKLQSTTPTLTKEESIASPWMNLFIEDESIVETSRGAWDVDYGLEELEDKNALPDEKGNYPTYFEFSAKAHASLDHFRRFYDFVYEHDYTFRTTTASSPQQNWAAKFKYAVNGGTFVTLKGKSYNCTKGDVFRWSAALQDWVPAGKYYNGTDWETFNVFTFTGLNRQSSWDAVRRAMQYTFEQGIGEYVDLDDASYHLAFVKFVSGTDNRAKNTYFLVLGEILKENPNYGQEGHETEKLYIKDTTKDGMKIRFMADDLDTVLLTDNNGLQSKEYNLVEDSYREVPIYDSEVPESFKTDWGDSNNAFFYMYDLSFEADIKSKLETLINVAFDIDLNVNNPKNYFCNQFFGIQQYFPAVSYNHMSLIYYENAKYILDSKCIGSDESTLYGNNNIDPIELAHGSCLAAEKEFMDKRLTFLATYAEATKLGDASFITCSSAGDGESIRLLIKMVPYLDFYPLLMWEKNTFVNMRNNSSDLELHANYKFATIEKRVKAGTQYTLTVSPMDRAINQGIYNIGLYKTLDITGLKYSTLSTTMSHLTDFTIDNANLNDSKGQRLPFYGDAYPDLQISSFTASLPVIERLNLKNMILPEGLDLSKAVKLLELDLTNSRVKNVILPESGRFKKAILPNTLTTFEIYNNPKLEEVIFQGIGNLENVFILGDKCGKFNINDFCEQLVDCGALREVTLRNVNLQITLQALNKLCRVNKISITGTINIVAAAGDPQLATIDFDTLLMLVKTFGDFTAKDSKVKINYTSLGINSINCEPEVSLYSTSYPAIVANPFRLNIGSGNNIAITKNTEGKPVLNITYSINPSTYASIDKYTGDVTLNERAATAKDATATVTISVMRTSGTAITKTSTVRFQWTAPKVGDFVYSNGDYSSSYTDAKNLIGMVYAVESNGTDSGTAYVIGKEYVSITNAEGTRVPLSYYGGFVNGGDASSSDETLQTVAYLLKYLETKGLNTYYTVNGPSNGSYFEDSFNNINYASRSVIFDQDNPYMGKSDTSKYIEHVNSILQVLYNIKSIRDSKCIEQTEITVDGNTSTVYRIPTLEKLNSLCSLLRTTVNTEAGITNNSDIVSSILYPYFYSMYLYEPQDVNDDLIPAFRKGNWYAPSVFELAKVLYYRGYSVKGTNWQDADDVRKTIDSGISSGTATYLKAIFSNAKLVLDKFPTCWNVLAGSGSRESNTDNLTTTIDTSNVGNFGYLNVRNTTWSGSGSTTTYTSQWVAGSKALMNNNDFYISTTQYENTWRLTKHMGVPFTQFEYSKS